MRSILSFLLLASLLVSCQKVKDLANKAKEAAGSATADAAAAPAMDKGLEALIDRNEEGVRFRKDLAFPKNVDCTITSSMRFDGVRIFRKTAFGSETGVSSATNEENGTWSLRDKRITFSYETAIVTPATELPKPPVDLKAPPPSKPGPAPKNAPPAAPAAPVETAPVRVAGESLSGGFRISEGKWRVEHDQDFMKAARLRELQETFDDEAVIQRGLMPRKLWFGKTRWKEGSKLTLSGDEMALVLARTGIKGRLDLVFEGVDAVDGHPCGRFAVSGKCSGYESPLIPRGTEAEISITEGKIWASLVHPLVLKQELDTVMTLTEKGKGTDRTQGHVILKQSIVWKPGT